ncbi:MAG: glycosyltransferase [Bacteroidia bacterium]|nr:glycosyltransferase [Bacteroidia bacterium]
MSVINDLATDQRVLRTCSVLEEHGLTVILFGRELENSPSVSHLPYKTKRVKMAFTKGPLFYFFFNLRLYFFLISTKADALFANDLDTLWANYCASKLKKIPLIYDSHEIFCEVPELQKTPLKKRIWERLEKRIIPKLKHCITVNQSIADYFKEKYNTSFSVVRNIPQETPNFKAKSKQELGIPANKKILILQGAGINIDRGAEELVQAMTYVDAHLYIIGGGDVFPTLKKLLTELNLTTKITIKDKMPKAELLHFTHNADIGISIDKDTNLNYHFSLPNKIFDYIQAGIPVLASNLPEIKNIISRYNIGCVIDNHEPKHIAEKINFMLNSSDYTTWKDNTTKAARENSWENEKQNLEKLIQTVN